MAEYVTVWRDHEPTKLHWGFPVVRCADCRWSHEAPLVDGWHLECGVRPLSRHYTPDMGFCHLGERRADA